jgi:hypothetical protein
MIDSSTTNASDDSRRQTPPPFQSTKQPSSTPLKKRSPIQPLYSTLSRFRLQTIHTIGTEMFDFFVGPMPVRDFLHTFMRCDSPQSIPTQFQSGCFDNVIRAKSELATYSPFVSQTVFWTTYALLILVCLSPDYHSPKIGPRPVVR